MKRMLILVIAFLILIIDAKTQVIKDQLYQYQKFPIIGSLQFHSLGTPFRKIGQNLSNVGFTLGTEISFDKPHKWLQQFNMGWYNNHNAGNGLMFYTQTVYRPHIIKKFFIELKGGIGLIKVMHPVAAYIFKNGNWVEMGNIGKNMLMIPFGVSFGYNNYKSNITYFSPFISYQVFIDGVYNKSFPIMINSLIQVGVSVHLKKIK